MLAPALSSAAEAGRAQLDPERDELKLPIKHAPLSKAHALVEANRCLFCDDAPCIKACPTEIDVPGFIRRIATDNVLGAAKKILSQNVLGLSCGAVCPVEVLCEGSCVFNHTEQPPIRIGALQHYATSTVLAARGFPLTPLKHPQPRRVAIVGGGPAGLATAVELKLLGHEPVIFEARAYPGGLNTYGIAPYKLRAGDAFTEVGYLESLGIPIHLGQRVGKEISGKSLLEEYAAVVIACGLGEDADLDVPGRELAVGATAWIEQLKVKKGSASWAEVQTALVIGGGNTAMDCAQELKLLGVPQVMVAYRKRETDMSAYAHEWAVAKELGVRLLERVTPLGFTGHGQVSAAQFRVGNASDQVLQVDCQLVIWAIGQDKRYSLVSEFPGVNVAQGKITVDENLQTGCQRVFACGDAINGGKEVVNAAADGKLVAKHLNRLWS